MPANGVLDGLIASVNAILVENFGAFIDAVSFQVLGDQDRFCLILRSGPAVPDVTITLDSVHRTSIQKPPDAAGAFVDEAWVKLLPRLPAPWPDEANALVVRHEELPDLIWFKVVGPMVVDVVAATITVSVAQAYL